MSLAPHQILPASPRAIADAARRLVAGEPVALPTETVYGLAARADSAEAVAAVYSVKGRPDFNPLIVHVLNAAAAEQIAVLDKRAKALAAAFWPGPLTMVLPMVALSTAEQAPISTSSSITTWPTCGTFRCCPSTVRKPKPSPPKTAPL